MTDTSLIVAELRADDLLRCLQAAVAGDAHWRLRAQTLLEEIASLQPEGLAARLREIDARKRMAEMMEDICYG